MGVGPSSISRRTDSQNSKWWMIVIRMWFGRKCPYCTAGRGIWTLPPGNLDTGVHNTGFTMGPLAGRPTAVNWEDLPANPTARRAFLYNIMDLFHPSLCFDGNFHPHPNYDCVCILCGGPIDYHHHRSCPELADLTPCAKMKRLRLLWTECMLKYRLI